MQRLASVNLNLLVALDALLEERNVTRAARRLGVTQSAMSHTLRQLREQFDDPLLVRAGRKMVPTPRAAALVSELRGGLEALGNVVRRKGAFDPARFEGQLTLATQDGVVAALTPMLSQRFRREAPLAELRFVRPPSDLAVALEDGRIDVATAPPIDVPAGLVRDSWAQQHTSWSVICAADHPAEEMDLDAFCSWPHAMMTLSGRGPSFVDHALARLGRERRVALRIPFLLAIPRLLQGTDLISVVVGPAASGLAELAPLKIFPAPLPLPLAPMTLLFHARFEGDPAHRWFRDLVKASWPG